MSAVQLIGTYGDDKTHALSAWTSTSRDLTPEKEARIPVLLEALAREGHLTPFEKSGLHFLVTVDQATHIHLLKHRIGVSINGESARYKELKEDKTYLPVDWLGKSIQQDVWFDEDGRPYTKGMGDWHTILREFTDLSNRLYHQALAELTPTLGRKRAKESARFFKTMNSMITMDVMFNWRSFMHFISLRTSEHAQVEVAELGVKMLRLVEDIPSRPFRHSLKAFGHGGE
jgi:flavin-dependent thymidylate synthase